VVPRPIRAHHAHCSSRSWLIRIPILKHSARKTVGGACFRLIVASVAWTTK
jgi:hypothetical protein